LIGQFDPAFTAIMDEVMALARAAFRTASNHCLAISGPAHAGIEAILNTLLEPGERVAIGGGSAFFEGTADVAIRYGASVEPLNELRRDARLAVVPHLDPERCEAASPASLARQCHEQGAFLLVDATMSLGAMELRVDEWGLDACVAGVDYAVAAPAGMTLATWSDRFDGAMRARRSPPPTSFLDLLQLQAYWSPERLNHHTAPTSLIYGLHEALRALLGEGLDESWRRHTSCGRALREGLSALGLEVIGEGPYAVVEVPAGFDEAEARGRLAEQHGIAIRRLSARAWRLGLVGPDARLENVNRVLLAMERVLAHR
jgi:aspartate aminotransferase-like enzyme